MRVHDDLHLVGRYLVERWSLLSAERLLEKTLERIGRDVSREALIAALESRDQIATGSGPPVTFDAAHHNGTPVVHVLRYDHERREIVPID